MSDYNHPEDRPFLAPPVNQERKSISGRITTERSTMEMKEISVGKLLMMNDTDTVVEVLYIGETKVFVKEMYTDCNDRECAYSFATILEHFTPMWGRK